MLPGEFGLMRSPWTRLPGSHLALPTRCGDDLLLLFTAHDVEGDTLCAMPPLCGPSGIRTRDLLNAIETRSQLRYGPVVISVDLAGFEPATSSVRLKRAPNCATGPHGGRIVPALAGLVK